MIDSPGYLIPLVTLVLLLVTWLIFGRDGRLPPMVVQHFPPQGIPPWQALCALQQCRTPLITGPVSISRITSATILDLYYRGILDLQIVTQGRKSHLEKIILKDKKKADSIFETRFIEILFEDKRELLLKEYDKNAFVKKLKSLIKEGARYLIPLIYTRPSKYISRVLTVFFDTIDMLISLLMEMIISLAVTFIFLGGIPVAVVAIIMHFVDQQLAQGLITTQTRERILTFTGLTAVFTPFVLMAVFSFKKKAPRGLLRFIFWIYRVCLNSLAYVITLVVKLSWIVILYFLVKSWTGWRPDIINGLFISLVLIRLFSLWMPKWNPDAREKISHLKGFFEYIRRVDADSIQRLSLENPDYFRTTLPFALIAGCGKRWIQTLHKIGTYDGVFLLFYHFSRFFESVSDITIEITDDYLHNQEED